MRVVGEFGPDEIRVRASRARLATAALVAIALGFAVPVIAERGGLGVVVLALLVLGVVGVMAFVAWVKWFHAVHDVVVAVDKARFRGSWWVWAWLIPVANWIIPKLMLNDLWNAADTMSGPRRQPVLVNVWWGINVVSGVAFYVADEHRSLEAIGWVALVVSYALSIWVIPKVTEVALLTQDAYQRASIEPPSMGITQPVT